MARYFVSRSSYLCSFLNQLLLPLGALEVLPHLGLGTSAFGTLLHKENRSSVVYYKERKVKNSEVGAVEADFWTQYLPLTAVEALKIASI